MNEQIKQINQMEGANQADGKANQADGGANQASKPTSSIKCEWGFHLVGRANQADEGANQANDGANQANVGANQAADKSKSSNQDKTPLKYKTPLETASVV